MKKLLTLSNCLFVLSIIVTTTLAIIYSSLITWIIWLSSILGILSSKTATEGKWLTFVFDIISYGLYIYVCIFELYYGELTLSIIIIIIHLFGLFQWKNNSDEDNVVIVKRLKTKEILISTIISLVIFVVYGYVLFLVGSKYPFLNAIPTIVYLLGNYFSIRRSILQFYCYILYEIFFIALWILVAVEGEFVSIIFLIGGICEFIYGIIGIVNWKKIQKEQQSQISK